MLINPTSLTRLPLAVIGRNSGKRIAYGFFLSQLTPEIVDFTPLAYQIPQLICKNKYELNNNRLWEKLLHLK